MQTVVLNDPRLNVSNEMAQVVTRGSQRLTQYVERSDGTSTSGTSWSYQPPSTKTLVDRHFLMRYKIKLTAVGGEFQLGTASGLRQAPISSIIDIMNISLNGGNLSDNISDRIHTMLRFNTNNDNIDGAPSMSPMMGDQYQKYDDWKTYGSNRNPLASYGEVGYTSSRGGFVAESESPTELVYTLTEPVFMSPFLTGMEQHQDQAFVNINQIDVRVQYVTDISRVFCHYNEPPNNLTAVNVEFLEAPEMIVNYLTPPSDFPLPMLQILPFYKPNDFRKKEGVYNPGEQFEVRTNTIKINQVPRHFDLLVKRSKDTSTLFTSDTFARIDKIEVLWNNESSVMGTHVKQGLYNISKKNGLSLSYPQYDKYVGSVLRVSFGTDIGLPSGIAPSTVGQYTISVSARCTNIADEPIEFESTFTLLLEGAISISENSLSQNIGLLTVEEVANAEATAPQIDHTNPAVNPAGGSFWSSLKHFINKAAHGIGTAANVTSKYIAPALTAVAPEFGAPLMAGAAAVGRGADFARKATGGRLSGGGYGNMRRRLTRRR